MMVICIEDLRGGYTFNVGEFYEIGDQVDHHPTCKHLSTLDGEGDMGYIQMSTLNWLSSGDSGEICARFIPACKSMEILLGISNEH